MGEFGRTPLMGTQGSTDGRNHWPNVMSMALAGGGFRHGQVIGASEPDGSYIKERPVTPADLAATIYHHMGIPPTPPISTPPAGRAKLWMLRLAGRARVTLTWSGDRHFAVSVRLCSDIRTRFTADQRRVGPDDAVADVLMAAEIDRKRQRLDA